MVDDLLLILQPGDELQQVEDLLLREGRANGHTYPLLAY